MKYFFTTALFIFQFISCFAQAPSFEWGYSSAVTINDIATDVQNNIYSVGIISGTVDVDPGQAILNVTSSGQSDIIILKQDSNGNLLWHYKIGGSLGDGANSIEINSNGEVIIVGYFESSNVDFDFGIGSSILNCQGTQKDIFFLKLSSNGSFINAKRIGGQNNDIIESFDLDIDSQNNSYLTGYFTGVADMEPNEINTFFISSSGRDTYVCKVTNNFDLVWAKKFSSTTVSPAGIGGYEKGVSICVDSQFNVHVAGEFFGTTDVDPSTNTYNITSVNTGLSDPEINIFHVKLDVNGNLVNGYSIPGIRPKMIRDNQNHILLSGLFNSSFVDFDPGPTVLNISVNGIRCFLIKMTSDFNVLWGKNIGATQQWIQMDTDASNNIYFANQFSNSIQIDPNGASVSIASLGSSNVLISKFTTNGFFEWVITYGTFTSSNVTNVNSIKIGNDYSLFTSGSFGTSADIDPGNSTYIINSSPGNNYLLKLNQCVPTSSTQTVSACTSYQAANGQVYNQSGVYTSVLQNAAGCDSTVTLNLTINNPVNSILSVTSCGNYASPSGNVYTSTGNYIDTISTAAGCDSIISIDLTIQAIDTVVTRTGNTLTVLQNGASYQWINCTTNQPIPGATGQSYTATSPGWYAVMVTLNGCTEQTNCRQIKKLVLPNPPLNGNASIDEEDLLDVKVYPNPTRDKIFLDYSHQVETRIFLTDLSGRIIIQAENTAELDLQPLNSGTYYLTVYQLGGVYRQTVVKM